MTDSDPSPEQVERDRLEALPGDTYPDGRPKMHRHSMSFDIHRDDECDRGVLPDGKWATSRRRVYVFDDDVLPEHEAHIARRGVPVTAPLLATRDALAAELHRLDHGDWISGTPRTPWGTSREAERRDEYLARADAILGAGVVRDPATLADDEALVARVAATDYEMHAGAGAGAFDDDWLTEAEQHLRALAAALTEDPS